MQLVEQHVISSHDPRYGVNRQLHSTDNWGYQTYAPPTSGRGNDWILILEDDAAGFPLPGGSTVRRRQSLTQVCGSE